MKKMIYSNDLNKLIEMLLQSHENIWKGMQHIWLMIYTAYAMFQFGRGKQLSYHIIYFGELMVFYLIYISHKIRTSYEAGTFLAKKNERIRLISYARRYGIPKEWVEKNITESFNNFVRDNKL